MPQSKKINKIKVEKVKKVTREYVHLVNLYKPTDSRSNMSSTFEYRY